MRLLLDPGGGHFLSADLSRGRGFLVTGTNTMGQAGRESVPLDTASSSVSPEFQASRDQSEAACAHDARGKLFSNLVAQFVGSSG